MLYNYKCTNCKSCLHYISTKDHQLIFKCIENKKNHIKHFNKDLTKRIENKCEFYDRDINEFIWLLRKGAYPYEYMDSWERFDEKLIPSKKDFYSNLIWKILQILQLIIHMQREYLKTLIIKI